MCVDYIKEFTVKEFFNCIQKGILVFHVLYMSEIYKLNGGGDTQRLGLTPLLIK